MKRITLYGLLLLSLGMVACGGGHQTDESEGVMVKVDTVRSCGSGQALQFPGRVVSASEVNLSFKVAGTIQRVCVKEGDHVSRGQLIAEMDPIDYRVQLTATEAEYAQVKAEAERVIGLYNDGGTTAAAYDRARYGLQQIEAKLQNHRNQLSYTRIYAPYDGYVQKCYREGRETVSAGLPVVSLLSGEAPEVEVNLPAASYVLRDQFASYTCTMDVLPDEEISLQLVSILPQANANQLYTMRLRTTQEQRSLSPGMSVWVTISVADSTAQQMRVATTAILEQEGKTSLYLYNSKTRSVHRVPVQVQRLHTDGTCQVTGQLHVGDIVVTNGVHSLTDGQRVRLLPAVSSTNVGGLL